MAFYFHYRVTVIPITLIATIVFAANKNTSPIKCTTNGKLSEKISELAWYGPGESVLVRLDEDIEKSILQLKHPSLFVCRSLLFLYYPNFVESIAVQRCKMSRAIDNLKKTLDEESENLEINVLADRVTTNLKKIKRNIILFGVLQLVNLIHVITKIFLLFWFFLEQTDLI